MTSLGLRYFDGSKFQVFILPIPDNLYYAYYSSNKRNLGYETTVLHGRPSISINGAKESFRRFARSLSIPRSAWEFVVHEQCRLRESH